MQSEIREVSVAGDSEGKERTCDERERERERVAMTLGREREKGGGERWRVPFTGSDGRAMLTWIASLLPVKRRRFGKRERNLICLNLKFEIL